MWLRMYKYQQAPTIVEGSLLLHAIARATPIKLSSQVKYYAVYNYRGSLQDLEGSTLYVTLFPCGECVKTIIQVGIKKSKFFILIIPYIKIFLNTNLFFYRFLFFNSCIN